MVQWMTDWYPHGKTSVESRFNMPGKIGWLTMESVALLVLGYIMCTLPAETGLTLPTTNWVMAGMFMVHYVYRAVLSPLLNPSMSPVHAVVWLSAVIFQVINATSIGGWLAGHGPTSALDWSGRSGWIQLGIIIWAAGLLGNIYHDDELREIRRAAAARAQTIDGDVTNAKGQKRKTKRVDKVYMMPQNGLFRFILYPHYVCEWIEWAGFWIVGGGRCTPARTFVLNEIATMAPRALQGKRWYLARFGRNQVGGRGALVPGVL